MGRGNCRPNGKYEGVYYIDNDNLWMYRQKTGGEFAEMRTLAEIPYEEIHLWEFDDIQTEDVIAYTLDELSDTIMRKFKSFSKRDKWISRNQHAILENGLFYIAIEDNEWSIAVELLQKSGEFGENLTPFQKRYHRQYLDGIKEALFEQFDSLGIYSSAWTSGTIRRENSKNGGIEQCIKYPLS